MVPKGRLVMSRNTEEIAENENKNRDQHSFLCNILKTMKVDKRTPLEFVITGDGKYEIIKMYSEKLLEAGYHNFNFLNVSSEDKNQEMVSSRLARANIVIFMDDPANICRILQKSSILKILYKKYLLEESFMIIGINVGAMCIPGAFMHGSRVVNGLGFVNSCIIDTEFDYETGFRKLIKTVILNKEYFGLGLSDNTALIIEEGVKATCKGDGPVMLINARNVKNFNTRDFNSGKTMFVKNLKGHILIDGCTLNLNSGEVTTQKF